ncbi:putative Zn-finger protein [Breoghania corrubedonensis]|uniref:Putative Zn-finger protein n=1 Tax=Breoghania corrubedonensis TaxID=665038 RepID=A0A2T5VD17_9HYPH|nr:zinc-finger domain-containing protein [Breoghania corrubedonensis]PTW61659.1 putative Zn-finger protein [Breoghania corrubedonensis]
MADQVIPHFQNDGGVETIRIGAREFMCIGATPPFDHPHVFLDMGADASIVCPYCSTHYVHDAELAPGVSDPAGCLWAPAEAAE